MRKLLIVLFTMIGTVAGLQGIEYSDQGLYMGGFGGVNFFHNFFHEPKHFMGGTGGFAVGYKFENNLRLEAELALRYNPVKCQRIHGTVETYTAMLNSYFDINLGEGWTPYIGAGLGYGYSHLQAKFRNISAGIKCNHFCYQGMAGVSRKVSEDLHLGLEYRCLLVKNSIRDHSALITLKRYF